MELLKILEDASGKRSKKILRRTQNNFWKDFGKVQKASLEAFVLLLQALEEASRKLSEKVLRNSQSNNSKTRR